MSRIRVSFCLFALLFSAINAISQDDAVGLRMMVLRTEAEAATVLARLRSGEKFDDLARKQSVDPSGRAGGYLGVLTVSQLRPEFQAALDGLKPGQISPIAKIGSGYALFQLLTDEDTLAIELKSWIDGGKDPSSPIVERLWMMAIAANDAGVIRRILDGGVDVNASFGDGSTVLMGAAQAGQLDSVRALLAAGASLTAQTQDGTTALLAAAQAGQTNVVRALVTAGAAVNARKKNGVTPLIDAAFGGHAEIVRVLLDSGADPNLTLEDGSTALMAASVKGHNDIVRALLAAGAQVNAGVKTGGTALMEAAYAGQAETVRLLLAGGADAKVTDPNGLTALMGAALKGSSETVRALLDAGAIANARDKKGWTALTYARASANTATVRMVLAATTDITAQERSVALGGAYMNEYYSSNESNLLDLAAEEFQKVLNVQPQNLAALEWMGAVEYLRWDKPPTLEQFKKAYSLLKKSVDLEPKDPDRNYWIAAISSIFASAGKGVPATNLATILDDGIQHATKALELDAQFADAMDHLGILYGLKGDHVAAAAARSNALRVRQRLGNRPSRFSDQFSRPALPAPPV